MELTSETRGNGEFLPKVGDNTSELKDEVINKIGSMAIGTSDDGGRSRNVVRGSGEPGKPKGDERKYTADTVNGDHFYLGLSPSDLGIDPIQCYTDTVGMRWPNGVIDRFSALAMKTRVGELTSLSVSGACYECFRDRLELVSPPGRAVVVLEIIKRHLAEWISNHIRVNWDAQASVNLIIGSGQVNRDTVSDYSPMSGVLRKYVRDVRTNMDVLERLAFILSRGECDGCDKCDDSDASDNGEEN